MDTQFDYIHITRSNFRVKTVFTYEYGYYEEKYGWEAKAFISHCLSQWSDEFEHLLDCWDKSKTIRELDIVNYWGPRFVKRFGKEFPHCDAKWYRNILRAELRSLALPINLIEEYFEKVGYEPEPPMDSAERYHERFSSYYETEVMPVPYEWIKIGYSGIDGGLNLANSFTKIAGYINKERLIKIVSWLLSGFTKNFDIFCLDEKGNIVVNTSLCNTINQHDEKFGNNRFGVKWFEGIYKAKFLSIRIPPDLLKIIFINK